MFERKRATFKEKTLTKTAEEEAKKDLGSLKTETVKNSDTQNGFKEVFFEGEEPSYGGKKLYIELLPYTADCQNLKAFMTIDSWKKIASLVKKRAMDQCEICETKTAKKYDIFARWHFILSKNPEQTKIGEQRLKRLLYLCSDCYEVSNFDMVMDTEKEEKAILHLAQKNRWPKHQVLKHIQEVKTNRDFMSRVPGYKFNSSIFTNSDWFVQKKKGS